MRVLIDTCIWSEIFRYKIPVKSHVENFKSLIHEDRALIIGPIRQEFLSGIKDIGKHKNFQESLRSFPDLPMKTEIFEMAAVMFNECRKNGISASSVDMMICAASRYYNSEIWTVDQDFGRYAQYIDIKIHNY